MEILHIAGWLKNFHDTDRESCGDLPGCAKPHPVSLLKNQDTPGFAKKKSEWQRELHIPLWTDQERKRAQFDHEGILGHKKLLKKEKKPSGFIQGSMETHTRSGVFEWEDTEKISAESASPSLKTNSPSSSLRPDMGRCRKYTNSGCNISNCHPSSSFEGSSNTWTCAAAMVWICWLLQDWIQSFARSGRKWQQRTSPISLLIDDGNKTSVILTKLPSMYMRKNRTDLPLQPKPFTSCLTDGMWSTNTTECEALSFDEANCQARVLQAIVMERRRNCNPEKHLKQQTMKCNLCKNIEDAKLLSLITIAGKFSCCYAMLCYDDDH